MSTPEHPWAPTYPLPRVRRSGSWLPAPSPALTWVTEVKFIVRVTVVAPVPESSVGLLVVADKDRKEDGGGSLEEETQQRQLQSPALGAVPGPSHGTEAARLPGSSSGRWELSALQEMTLQDRFHPGQAPPIRARPRPRE